MTKEQQFISAETISRLIYQGEYLLKYFHEEFAKHSTGPETEFWRGNVSAWRGTLENLSPDLANDLIARVRTSTGLSIPHRGPLAPDGESYLGMDSGADAYIGKIEPESLN
jgi:hypothetical protein